MPKGNRYHVAGTLKLYIDAARAISQGSNYASTITDTYNSVEGEGTPYIDAFSGYEDYHPAIPIWWVPYWGGSGYSIGWVNDNYNYQATQPTSNYSSRALGSALTLTFKPNNSAIRHEITYKYGSKTGTLVSKSSSATTYSWTPALSLATAFPNATSGVCTITCKSYESAASNARLIGTKTLNITLTIPTSVAPTISSRTISDAMTTQYTKFGAYIQNYSKIKVVTSAAGAQGSTISRIETTIDGAKYTGGTITSAVIKKSGSISVSTKVTDSRGRTATQSSNVSFLAYTSPKITSFTAFRANSTGTANDQGTYLGTRKTWSIASLGSKNDVSVKIETRPTGGSWTTRQTLTSGYSQSSHLYTTGSIANVDLSYEVRLTVSDYFTSVQATRDVLTAAAFIHYRGDKKGVAFGKRSEKQALEVAWPVEFYNTVKVNGSNIATEAALSALRDGIYDDSGNYRKIIGKGGYISTPSSGIIPESSNSAGLGYVGTSGWPFYRGYFADAVMIQGNAAWHNGTVTSSKAANGYIMFPNGVIIQWGIVDFTGTASSYKEFTFPIAFPSACRSVVGSFAITSGTWPQWTTVFGSVSRTGARAYVRDGDNGLTDSTKGYVYWLAMGY